MHYWVRGAGITDVHTIASGVLALQMCALMHQAFRVGSGNLNSDLHASVVSTFPLSYLLGIPSPKVIVVLGNTL